MLKQTTDNSNMDLFRLSGWITLLSAIDLIEETANQRGIDFDKQIKLKPEAIGRFVDARRDDVYHHLLTQSAQLGKTPQQAANEAMKCNPTEVLQSVDAFEQSTYQHPDVVHSR